MQILVYVFCKLLGIGWWPWLLLPQPLLLICCPFDAMLLLPSPMLVWMISALGWWLVTSVAPLPAVIADGVLGCLLVMSFAFVYVYMGDELFIVIPSIINAFEHICIDISICFMALSHKDAWGCCFNILARIGLIYIRYPFLFSYNHPQWWHPRIVIRERIRM